MKIFLDTNFLLRYFLKDEPEQFEFCKTLISQIEEGKFAVYTSGIIFLEMSYVLKSVYNLPFVEVADILDSVFSLRGMTIIEKTNTKLAFEFFKKYKSQTYGYKVKFTDCLIASQLPKGIVLVSFDEELSRIKELSVKSPQQIL